MKKANKARKISKPRKIRKAPPVKPVDQEETQSYVAEPTPSYVVPSAVPPADSESAVPKYLLWLVPAALVVVAICVYLARSTT